MRNSLSERRKWITEKHEWDIEDQEGTAMKAEELEILSEKVHQVYCKQYEKDHRKPYWTNGDYSKLDEKTKEYDRAIVRFMEQYANKERREHALKFAYHLADENDKGGPLYSFEEEYDNWLKEQEEL